MSRRKPPAETVQVHLDAGDHPKLRALTDGELRCFLLGVLPLAARATPRGALLKGGLPATAREVAEQAGRRVRPATAASALEKLRAAGVLVPAIACEVVHDFEEWNPGPRPSDTPEARRERKRASRARRARHDEVTRDTAGGHAGVTRDSRVTGRDLPPSPGPPPSLGGGGGGAPPPTREPAAGLHPALDQVHAVLAALPGQALLPDLAVNSALLTYPDEPDPVAAAHEVATVVHAGQLRKPGGLLGLFRGVLRRRAADRAAGRHLHAVPDTTEVDAVDAAWDRLAGGAA